LPDIKFVKDFKGQEAKKLVAKCPMNVFDIEDSGTSLSSTSLHQAAVFFSLSL